MLVILIVLVSASNVQMADVRCRCDSCLLLYFGVITKMIIQKLLLVLMSLSEEDRGKDLVIFIIRVKVGDLEMELDDSYDCE